MKGFLNIRTCAALVLGLSVSLGASAASVSTTSITKSCKPLIDKNKELPQVKIQGLTERVHKRLTRAQEMMAESRYTEAYEVLGNLANTARSDYVKATAYLNLAYAYAQNNDQNGSLPHFQNALKFGQGNLPNDRMQNIRMNVSGLLYGLGNKKEALKVILAWMDNSIVDDAGAYYMLAAMYAENAKMRDAACPAHFAITSGKEPKKNHYQMLMAIHWELNDVPGTAKILKDMIRYFPEEKSFWRQLSQIYFQMDKVDDALAIMEMFYLRGQFDKDQDYTWLSALFAYRDIPLRSAEILKEGIDKGLVESEKKMWENIAANYHLSNELTKAVQAYGKTAELSDTGEQYLRQAEILTDQEKWGEAVRAYDKAIAKGKLEDPGRAHLRKGVALVSMGRCDSAFTVLSQAQKFKKYRNQAAQWTNFAKDRKRANKC
ncbi:MAG: hypothetical protein OQK51_11430 [Kangiellaceae bacterium]|nr:hypothetical protein [Kangiellaceae bacterium]